MSDVNLKTRCIIVLDRSTSMRDDGKDKIAVSSYNEHVDDWQQQAKNGHDIVACLLTFNGDVFEHLWDVPVENLQKSSLESFNPSGSTALYDAIGYTIDRCNAIGDDRANNMVVITDGEENMSKHYNGSAVAELLNGCDASKKWTISILGASKSQLLAIKEATTGVQIAAWSNDYNGAKKLRSAVRTASARYFSERAIGSDRVDDLYSLDADYNINDSCEVKTSGGLGLSGIQLSCNSDVHQLNVGTADVFGTKGSCVPNETYTKLVARRQ